MPSKLEIEMICDDRGIAVRPPKERRAAPDEIDPTKLCAAARRDRYRCLDGGAERDAGEFKLCALPDHA